MKIISAELMRELDNNVINNGTNGLELMERAGYGMFLCLKDIIPNLTNLKIVIVCGKGNNAGDGLVLARYLAEAGNHPHVMLAYSKNMSESATTNLGRLQSDMATVVDMTQSSQEYVLREISSADIIVDCLFGTGFKGEMPEELIWLVDIVNSSRCFKVACDIPSGVNATTGETAQHTVQADVTITMALPKRGQVAGPGARFCGSIYVVDIGILEPTTPVDFELITPRDIVQVFPPRKRDAHKNQFGHLLVIAGSRGMTGAASMACTAALRIGTGLVTLAIPEELNQIMEVKLTEAMTLPVIGTSDGTISPSAWLQIRDFIHTRGITAALVGPGLGHTKPVRDFVRRLVEEIEIPALLDADALNVLSGECRNDKWESKIFSRVAAPLVITPHPGEFSRLTGTRLNETFENRYRACKRLAKANKLVCVLKGYRTSVSNGDKLWINPTGGPALAKGGSGDVLAGIIAGLMAQGRTPLESALAGVHVHGLAGDLLVRSTGISGEYSILPTEIVDSIPLAIYKVLTNQHSFVE